jgi:predicted Fe-Mo cluster-binding NifX family protein
MVLIAVPSNGDGGLNEMMNSRFGRCPSFTLVTVENGEIIAVKTVPNPGARDMGSAGIHAAEIIGSNNTNVLIAGLIGPNAAKTLEPLDVKVFHAPDQNKTIKQIIEQYIQGELEELKGPNIGAQKGGS